MKRICAFFIVVSCILALAGCSKEPEVTVTDGVTISYGKSSIYTKEDMDEAIALIREKFDTWEGCELHSISYVSDEKNNAENIGWMNELEAANDAEEVFAQCILFISDFHSPIENSGAWNPDQEYTGWQWWLARAEGGQWKLMTWGY